VKETRNGDSGMLQDAFDAFSAVFSPPFHRVMAKSLALTAPLLVDRI